MGRISSVVVILISVLLPYDWRALGQTPGILRVRIQAIYYAFPSLSHYVPIHLKRSIVTWANKCLVLLVPDVRYSTSLISSQRSFSWTVHHGDDWHLT